MMNIDLFLTSLYVEVDDFLKTQPAEKLPGPDCKLAKSEAMTLLIFSQWRRFSSERDFYRFAEKELLSAFPNLPSREQLNRQFRHLDYDVCNFFQHLAAILDSEDALYEALDASFVLGSNQADEDRKLCRATHQSGCDAKTNAVVTRNCKRRGFGWLFAEAKIGFSNRLGWFEGLKLLMSTTPDGLITGFGLASASEKEQPMAETFFHLRSHPDDNCPEIGSCKNSLYYPVDICLVSISTKWRSQT